MASNTIRYLGPATGRVISTKSDGKQGSNTAAGAFLVLPDNANDNVIVQANGYTKLAYVGTTANRPTTPVQNMLYIDTTLSKVIVFDGAVWRDPVTGSSV